MSILLEKFIERAPFAVVLWKFQSKNGKKDFFMQSYNSKADNYDRRNFSLLLNQPFKMAFPEAPELRNAFLTALDKQKTINFDEFEHTTFRKEALIFQIWIVPLDDVHILIIYHDITEEINSNLSKEDIGTFIKD